MASPATWNEHAEEAASKKQKVADATSTGVRTEYPENDDEIWKSQTWARPDGAVEDIVDIEGEPLHRIGFTNDYTRIVTAKFPPQHVTLPHRHMADTIMIVLVENGVDFINDVMGQSPKKGHMKFGQVAFAPYTSKPCVHKITNLSDKETHFINIEVLDTPPLSGENTLAAPYHELLMAQYNCRVYKFKLEPGKSCAIQYPFFYVRVVVRGSTVKTTLTNGKCGAFSWMEELEMGECHWKEPCMDAKVTNVGGEAYEAYICELK